MIKQASYKNRFYLFMVLIFICILIIYQFTLKKTFALQNSNIQLQEQFGVLQNAPSEILSLKNRLKKYDDYMNSGSSGDIQNNLLDFCSDMSKLHGVVLIEFPGSHVFNEGDLACVTYPILVQGKFISLLKFLNSFEDKRNIGNVVSADFFMMKNKKTRENELYLKMYIQNITTIEK